MNGDDSATLFGVILLANVVTMIVTIAATMRRPTASYRVISAVAIAAVMAALQQMIKGRFSTLSLMLSSLLSLLITFQVVLNMRNRRKSRTR
jgi:carbon starvation protein CstA